MVSISPRVGSSSPAQNGLVTWISQFNNQATMTNITAYIAANGITVHDTDDAVIWAQTAAREMIVRIEDSGGFSNPSTSVIYELIRQELKIACSNDSLNCAQEWYEREATLLSQSVEEMTSIAMSSEAQLGLEAL